MNSLKQSRRTSMCSQLNNDKLQIQCKAPQRHKINIRDLMNERKHQTNVGRSNKHQDILHKSNTIPQIELPGQNLTPTSNQKFTFNNQYFTGVIPLSSLQNISISNALFVMHSILNKCIEFYDNYGIMSFQISYWSLSSSGYLIVDEKLIMNSNCKNLQQVSLVEKVVQNIRKLCGDKVFDDFYNFYKRAKIKCKCDLKYTLSLIKSYCKCSKIHKNTQYDFVNSKKKCLNDIYSPSKTPSSIGYSKVSFERVHTLEDSHNDSLQKYSNCKSQQKKYLQYIKDIKNIKKSAQIEKKYKLSQYLTNMTKSNEIISQHTPINRYCPRQTLAQKQSFASTNNKSTSINSCQKTYKPFQNLKSLKPEDIAVNSPLLNTIPIKNNQCSLQQNVEQVQSQSQSDNEVQQDFSNNIYENNQWMKKYNNLFSQKKQLLQSFIDGKDEFAYQTSNPENLGKLARVVVESFLNSQDNSRLKNG